MAVVSPRAQYAAVARMRWQMLAHSLRTRRGSFELGARIISQTFFSFVGLLIGSGLGFAAWQIASHDSLRMLAALLWPVFLVWQFVPVVVASFQENADLSIFLRFPVSFRSYALLYILFGLFDMGSLVGGIALLGIFTGASIAQPDLIPWIALSLALFAVFNIFLTRMIFAWIDRWLAQRKTREIVGVVFLFVMLGAQLLNPAFYPHHGNQHEISQTTLMRAVHIAEQLQNGLPPGLSANVINSAHEGKVVAVAANLFFLALFIAAAGAILSIRLRAEYKGESLGEAPAQAVATVQAGSRRSLLEGSGPIAAVIEKEIRYLMRSGVMLYGFLAPLFVVFVFSGGSHVSRAPGLAAQFALPLGVSYSFLGLTRFVYNNLGGESAGIQLYFLLPTPFRKIMLAKNIVHVFIFLAEMALVCVIIAFRAGVPGPRMLAITFCWLLFAVPAQLAIGNVLSIAMPYRLRMTSMAREQGATGNVLLSMVMQLVIFGIGCGVYLLLARTGHAGLVPAVLLIFAAASMLFWWRTLANAGAMAERRKDTLIAALYKAQ